MTRESFSAQHLFDPGEASEFFEFHPGPHFAPEVSCFHPGNALWLAEFSRLIYRQDERERTRPPGYLRRNGFLTQRGTGWVEADADFFQGGSTEAALLTNESLGCAALIFRGTLGFLDAVTDGGFVAVPWEGTGNVHVGFKTALNEVWPRLAERLRGLRGPLFFAGHSLGGALATLAAARCLATPGLPPPTAVYSFGSPRVGDRPFAESLATVPHHRVVNDGDCVASVPPAFSLPLFPQYHHSGQMHRLRPATDMEVHPLLLDLAEDQNPVSGFFDFIQTVANLFTEAKRPGSALPGPLLDHSPVNYVARLARQVSQRSGQL